MRSSALTLLLSVSFMVVSAASTGAVDFLRDVQPLLTEKCVRCHGGVHKKSGLSFLTFEGATERLDSGARAVVPGSPDASEMINRVKTVDPDDRMPPDQPLTEREISILESWVQGGADWPAHWSFLPPQAPDLPSGALGGNPIDLLVRSRLEDHGWTPAPEADRHTLIRRLSLDLTGLLPDPGILDRYLMDDSPGWWASLVDEFMASPHFGERWARFWLDQARYADSDGYEKDRPRPNAWRYRDWVIHSINADMPYNEFSRWQLAGDLIYHSLPPEKRDPEMLVASAFHRQTLFNTEGGVDPEEDRTKRIIDRITTTGAVWMGMTVGCAQCHDHPYDPISQKEFYELFAFFNNDTEPEAEVPLRYGDPGSPTMKTPVMGVVDRDKHRPTYLFRRGDFLQPETVSGPVEPGFPAVLGVSPDGGIAVDRVDLADWLFDEDHPLTARVAVNQIWEKLFGRGLVATQEDWGRRGQLPSHPDLLDWLAVQFRRNGWSRKQLIRGIVLSRTYRQSAVHRPEYEESDPSNTLLFRQNRRRLEAESIRDIFLQAGNSLDLTVGGPSVFPPLAGDVAALSYANNFRWKTSDGGDRFRRGLYTFFKRTAPHPNLMVFDCTDTNTSVSGRMVSNTPLQALTTLQNEVFMDAARRFGLRMAEIEDDKGPEAAINTAFRIALSRTPHPQNETAPLIALLDESMAYFDENPDAARVFSGVTDTASAGQAAAWTVVARSILNLDEFITRN